MSEEIRVLKKITLSKAVMIIGLGGWGDAGRVSSFTVKYLVDKLGAEKFGEIPADRFHHFFIQRPLVFIERGVIQSYVSPRNDFFYWRNTGDGLDLLLLLGVEPHLNWPGYSQAILKLVKETGVERILTVGGYLADISHEDENVITASTNNEKLLGELEKAKVGLNTYRGPTSVYSELLWRARDKNLDVVSLWCAVPMYVRGLFPKASHSMLKKITKLIGMTLDLKDLREKAESFKEEFEKAAVHQRQLRDFIESSARRSREKEPTYIS